MAYVQVVVSDDQKTRWSEYVKDEPAVDSVSDLIRTGVEEYIARDDDSDPSDLNPQVVNGDLDEIESRLANLEDQLELLRLENIEEDQLEEIIDYMMGARLDGTAEYILKELGADPNAEPKQ